MISQDRLQESSLQAPSARRYLLVAILAPLLLGALVLWLQGEYRRSETIRVQSAQSDARKSSQITLLSRIKDAETAQRGYLLTGDPRFLEPYEPARSAILAWLDHPAVLDDAAFPPGYIPLVKRLVADKFAQLDLSIVAYRLGDANAATAMVAGGSGRILMDRLRQKIGRNIVRDDARADRRRAAFLQQRSDLQKHILVTIAAMFGLLLVFLLILWRMRRQRHALLTQAVEAAARSTAILDSTIDAILILNPQGQVETMNASALAMLGWPRDRLVRRDIATIIDLAPGTNGSFHQRIGLAGGRLARSYLADRAVRTREAGEIIVDVAMGVMRLPSGDHIVVSLRDLSERRRIEQAKDDLMATVSHELRTPLTSIVGSLGLLRARFAGTLPADADHLVEIAEDNSRRLIRLINDMLDIERIESGKLALIREPIDLRCVIDRACLGSDGLAQANHIELACAAPDRSVMVSGDAGRLLQVVTNLLANAIGAAPPGSIVDLRLSHDGPDRARIAVEDRGPGVPIAFRDRIFGRFERAALNDGKTGTGLGLAISRDIVLRHDGMIWFEDREGGGSRFVVTLPALATSGGGDDEPDTVHAKPCNDSVDDLAIAPCEATDKPADRHPFRPPDRPAPDPNPPSNTGGQASPR